jgi:hypothetical protein
VSRIARYLALAVLVSNLSSPPAWAAPINITIDAAGNLLNIVGIADGAQYDALVAPPPSNNPADNLDFLDAMTGRWNGVPLAPAMPAAGTLALDQGSLGGALSYTGPAGYQYVVFHWGQGQAGQGGWWSAYYVDGESITFSAVPQVGGQNVGGFSSARYFGTVPDGGTTLMLLGAAMVGIGALRRKRGA